MAVLNRLISRKIWEDKTLWQGFIICADAHKPDSFSALVQLPSKQVERMFKDKPKLRTRLLPMLAEYARMNEHNNVPQSTRTLLTQLTAPRKTDPVEQQQKEAE